MVHIIPVKLTSKLCNICISGTFTLTGFNHQRRLRTVLILDILFFILLALVRQQCVYHICNERRSFQIPCSFTGIIWATLKMALVNGTNSSSKITVMQTFAILSDQRNLPTYCRSLYSCYLRFSILYHSSAHVSKHWPCGNSSLHRLDHHHFVQNTISPIHSVFVSLLPCHKSWSLSLQLEPSRTNSPCEVMLFNVSQTYSMFKLV